MPGLLPGANTGVLAYHRNSPLPEQNPRHLFCALEKNGSLIFDAFRDVARKGPPLAIRTNALTAAREAFF
jgi:hypothetical protein